MTGKTGICCQRYLSESAVDRGLLLQRANDDLVLVVRNVPVVTAPLSPSARPVSS